jgi:UDP-3-O-[3-hydroxymyristoyl] glucosamine N-acyltransferase
VTFTLGELAKMSGGELHGDPDQELSGAAALAEATADEIAFYSDPRYGSLLRKTRAAAVFVPLNFSDTMSAAQIRVANPSKAFEQVVLKFAPNPISFAAGVHSSAIVDPSVKLGNHVSIQPHAVIEAAVSIGDDTVVGAGSYIGHESVIGAS